MKPLAVDLCCGLGGWTDGLLAEGWDVVGFDVERHHYGDHKYPAQLVLQDILTLNGHQFRGKVSLIVASPPCQEFSHMAMPWTRAKQIAAALRGGGRVTGTSDNLTVETFPEGYTGSRTISQLTALFDACLRIGREAGCPIVIENVVGAQKWVGKAAWHFGSYYLWGDVPALMPMTGGRKVMKSGIKGGSWFNIGSPGQKVTNQNPVHDAVKAGKANADHTLMQDWGRRPPMASREQTPDPEKGTKGFAARLGDSVMLRRHGSKSSARKAASARIAMIPLALSRHIAQTYRP